MTNREKRYAYNGYVVEILKKKELPLNYLQWKKEHIEIHDDIHINT